MQTRIAGYDFARCLALFGLVVANFRGDVEHVDLDLLYDLIHGGATATFLVLGGIGISLLKQRNQRTNDAHRSADSRKRLIRRAASVLVVGICCSLIWHTNFLCRYSVCIAIGALLLTVSNRWLWSLAFIFVLIWAVFTFWILDYYEIFGNLGKLHDSAPWTMEGMVFRVYLNGFHFIFFWAAFLLIGMWLGRWKVHYLQVRRGVFFGGIAVALVSAYIPWLLIRGTSWLLTWVLSDYHPPSVWDSARETIRTLFTLIFMPLHFFGICGIATAIIGGSVMLTDKFLDAKWTRSIIVTGRFALTLYVAHLVIGKELLKALGLFWFPIESAVIFCTCAVIFSHFWRKQFERGPIEWAMRRITG